MFLGTYPVSVTSGKRVSIPSIFREELGRDLVLSQWYDECLVLVNKSTLNTLLGRVIGSEELIIEPVRKTEHFIYASSFEVIPDEQGRIILPDRLITYAKLTEQIYFLGIGDRVEIWDKTIWDEKERQVSVDAASYIEEISKRK